jgi:hypothetical protein
MEQAVRTPGEPGSVRARLLAADDLAWAGFLATVRHDVFHLPAWAELGATAEPGSEARALLVEAEAGAALVPLLVRPIAAAGGGALGVVPGVEAGLRDAVSPRGYATPLLRPVAGEDPGVAERALVDALVTGMREQRIVTAFVRLHPRLGPVDATLAAVGEVVPMSPAVGLDLGRGREALWAGFRSNHRRDIRGAERAGYHARFDDDWAQLDGFVAAYDLAMERLGAAAQWRLGRAHFDALRAVLGHQIRLCVVERDGELACGVVVTEVDGIVEYLYSATVPAHVAASPSKLAIAHLIDWGIARGDRLLELGGTPADGGSLAHFKLGFAPDADHERRWQVIADREAYDRLVAARGGGAAAGGWFPAYRAPLG